MDPNGDTPNPRRISLHVSRFGFPGFRMVHNERRGDSFEPSKSDFVAVTRNSMGDLAIRCLGGKISLLLISGPSIASVGTSSELKIVGIRCGFAKNKMPK